MAPHTLRVQIVTPMSTGLVADEEVLLEFLAKMATRVPIEVERTRVPNIPGGDPSELANWPSMDQPFDVQFLLEMAWPSPQVRKTARRAILIPNLEVLDAATREACFGGFIDEVWAKTQLTMELGPRLLPGAPLHFTGWSSRSRQRRTHAPQDFRRFLHVRGKATHRQSQIVIDCWHANPTFPRLDIVWQDPGGLSFEAPLACGNVVVHQRHLTTSQLARLQNQAGVHICPSLIEGFGHYINEARSCGAVVLVPNGPPMSEFVDGNSGFLIDVVGRSNMRSHGVQIALSDISVAHLTAAIQAVLATSPETLKTLGRAARRRYLEEKQAFHRLAAGRFSDINARPR